MEGDIHVIESYCSKRNRSTLSKERHGVCKGSHLPTAPTLPETLMGFLRTLWYLTEPLYCVSGVPLMPFYGVFGQLACVFWYLTEPLYCVFGDSFSNRIPSTVRMIPSLRGFLPQQRVHPLRGFLPPLRILSLRGFLQSRRTLSPR